QGIDLATSVNLPGTRPGPPRRKDGPVGSNQREPPRHKAGASIRPLLIRHFHHFPSNLERYFAGSFRSAASHPLQQMNTFRPSISTSGGMPIEPRSSPVTGQVTGELLGSMGMPPLVEIDGRKVFICCKGCEAALRKEPAKYLSKLDGK